MARTVVAPDRVKWKVHRQWAPMRVRFHKKMNLENWLETRGGSGEGGGFTGVAEAVFDSPTGILLALGATAVAVVLFLVIFPIVAIALEIVLLIIIVLAALVGRVLLRRGRVRPEAAPAAR